MAYVGKIAWYYPEHPGVKAYNTEDIKFLPPGSTTPADDLLQIDRVYVIPPGVKPTLATLRNYISWEKHYEGLTYVTSGEVNAQFDLYPQTTKRGNFTIIQLDGDFSATIVNDNGRSGWSARHYANCPDVYAPGSGTYTMQVTDYESYSTRGFEFFKDSMPNVIGLLSFDGYGKTQIECTTDDLYTFAGVTFLPQSPTNLNHCENLVNIKRLFWNAHITSPLIPFIEALIEVAPGVRPSDRHQIFTAANCTGAPDIYDAYTKYRDFFLDEIPVPHFDFDIVATYSDARMILSWTLDPDTHALSEDVHFTLAIDGGQSVDMGTAMQYSTADMETGEHSAVISGTCSHGETVSTTISFTITDMHRDFTVKIDDYDGEDNMTWTTIYG